MKTIKTRYEVKYEGDKPVLITNFFTMKDGEVIKHVETMEYDKARAIHLAYERNISND